MWLRVQINPWSWNGGRGKGPAVSALPEAAGRETTRAHGSTFIRVTTIAALGVALQLSLAFDPPNPLPGVALGSVTLLRLEVALAAFLGVLLFVTAVYHGLIRGVPPIGVSGSGITYPEEVVKAVQTVKGLQSAKESVRENVAGEIQ